MQPSAYSLRRNNYIFIKHFNGITKKTLGDRVFAVANTNAF